MERSLETKCIIVWFVFDQTYGPWTFNFIKVDSNKMSSFEIFDILLTESQSFGKFVSTGITYFIFFLIEGYESFFMSRYEKKWIINYVMRKSCLKTAAAIHSSINYLRRWLEWEGVGKDLLYIIPNLPNMLLPISNGTSRKGVIILGWWRVGTSSHLRYVFFDCCLAAPRPTLGHYRKNSLTHSILITAL